MRTEEREVTVTKTVYIADDGKVFYNEKYCWEYEYQLKEKTLKMYGANFEKADVASAAYVHLATPEEVSLFKDVSKYRGFGTDGVNEPGLYILTPDEYWVNITPAITYFNSIQS